MRKSRFVYFAAETAAGIVFAAVSLAAPAAALAAFALFTLWWTLYFRGSSYKVSGGSLVVSSGVFFRKTRTIPLISVLRTTRLTTPFLKSALLTVIHTAGGSSVIFADFSTESIEKTPPEP